MALPATFAYKSPTAPIILRPCRASLKPPTTASTAPRHGREFQFRRGPLFAQVVLADEINRATPKRQSALLEVQVPATAA